MDPLTVQLALLLVAIVAIVAMALNKDKVAEPRNQIKKKQSSLSQPEFPQLTEIPTTLSIVG